jgi:mRNA-degrading endonuclease toxin of MazEF toxin-antitoxin module
MNARLQDRIATACGARMKELDDALRFALAL